MILIILAFRVFSLLQKQSHTLDKFYKGKQYLICGNKIILGQLDNFNVRSVLHESDCNKLSYERVSGKAVEIQHVESLTLLKYV